MKFLAVIFYGSGVGIVGKKRGTVGVENGDGGGLGRGGSAHLVVLGKLV